MSKFVYRLLLHLYPIDLRTRWEEEMLDLFDRQLADSWLDAWRCALVDLRHAPVVRPLQGVLVIPLFSAAISATALFCLIWALNNSKTLLWLSHNLFANHGG